MKNPKMAPTQAAAKLFLLCLISFLFASFSMKSQTLLPTNNKGGYTLQKISGKTNNTTIRINGKAMNLKDNSEISDAKITFICTKVITNKKGEYEFLMRNNDLEKNYLKIIALGFKTVETDFFQIKPGINLKINFYLEEDDKPFIDCVTN